MYAIISQSPTVWTCDGAERPHTSSEGVKETDRFSMGKERARESLWPQVVLHLQPMSGKKRRAQRRKIALLRADQEGRQCSASLDGREAWLQPWDRDHLPARSALLKGTTRPWGDDQWKNRLFGRSALNGKAETHWRFMGWPCFWVVCFDYLLNLNTSKW